MAVCSKCGAELKPGKKFCTNCGAKINAPAPAPKPKLVGPTDAEGQFALGTKYYNGDGVPRDYAKAVYWFTQAAEQGHAQAQFNLGACYYNGKCGKRDKEKAVYWCTRAAEQGYANAQAMLKTLS